MYMEVERTNMYMEVERIMTRKRNKFGFNGRTSKAKELSL